jgi:hypothetical protein
MTVVVRHPVHLTRSELSAAGGLHPIIVQRRFPGGSSRTTFHTSAGPTGGVRSTEGDNV